MIPKIIFIVPYKNRMEHKYFFSQYLTHILQEKNYEIYFSNQLDVSLYIISAILFGLLLWISNYFMRQQMKYK